MSDEPKTFRKVELKLSEVKAAEQSLLKLLVLEFPKYSTSYRLRRVAKKIESVLKDIEEERNKLLKEVGATINESHRRWDIPKNKQEIFDESYKHMMEEVEILEVPTIELSDIEGAMWHDGMNQPQRLSVMDLANLEFIITENGEAK